MSKYLRVLRRVVPRQSIFGHDLNDPLPDLNGLQASPSALERETARLERSARRSVQLISKVDRCQKILDYEFKDTLHCLKGLQASTEVLLWNGQYLAIARNNRLAILGDAIMKSVLCEKWHTTNRPTRTVIASFNVGRC